MIEELVLDKLPANPTKQEEIDFIMAISQSIPTNSYLRGLFTNGFLEYVKSHIENDITPNIFTARNSLVEEVESERANVFKLKEQIRGLESAIADSDRVIGIKDKAFEDLNDNMVISLSNAQESYDKLQREFDEVRTELYAEISQKNEVIRGLDLEIIRLKAQLFDILFTKE